MKPKLIFIALMALIAVLCIAPAQAAYIPPYVTGSLNMSGYAGDLYTNSSLTYQDPYVICFPYDPELAPLDYSHKTTMDVFHASPGVDGPGYVGTLNANWHTEPAYVIPDGYAGKNITQVTVCNIDGVNSNAYRTWYRIAAGSSGPWVTFSVSETGNFSHKLSGVSITSAGVTGVTNSSGMVALQLSPWAANHTYTAIAPGYSDETGSVGDVGLTGGTLFFTMTPGAGSTTIRTYFQAVDGSSGGSIHGANINIKDTTSSLWHNSSADADGTYYIDTLSNHTLSGYADYTGYTNVSRTGLTPFDGVYELIMWPSNLLPTPGTGNVNLIVMVNDRATSAGISGATVKFTPPTGSTQGATTNTAGTVVFQVPNMSVISLGVTFPSGSPYQPASTSITTSAFGPDTKRIEVDKYYATPTGTIAGDINGDGIVDENDVEGATPVPTVDTRTNAEKDQAMMDTVREWSTLLITAACIMTLLYIFGYKP